MAVSRACSRTASRFDIELDAHDAVRPDLSGWRRERLPEPWDERPIRVVPDWICEVISPQNAVRGRVTKRGFVEVELVIGASFRLSCHHVVTSTVNAFRLFFVPKVGLEPTTPRL